MSSEATVAELFELAIAVEKATEELYRRLEAKFAHHREIADFWGEYAADEAEHAQWLERLRDASGPERLSAPADPFMLEKAYKILQFFIEDTLQEIKNLEDAYQLVIELENSETNAIFEFLIANSSLDEETRAFLRSQLEDHLARLMELPTQFEDTVRRQVIKALE